MTTTYRTLLVDGGLAFKAWKASGKLTSFLKSILQAQQIYQAACVTVAWDCSRESGWRRQLSPAYKAKRPPVPTAFSAALHSLQADLSALGIDQARAPGCEADDVLHSLATTTLGPHLLMSSDKDMLQALRPGVDMLKPGSTYRIPDKLITASDLWKTEITFQSARICGLTPSGWGDLLTLAGDPTDGVPGLPGMGPRKALDLLVACPDFVRLLTAEKTDQARRECNARSATAAKWVERAIDHLEDLRLSRELVTLRLVEVDLVPADPDPEAARSLLEGAGLGRYVEAA